MTKPKTEFAKGMNPFASVETAINRKRSWKKSSSREALFNQMRTTGEVIDVPWYEFEALRCQIRRYMRDHELGETLSMHQRKDPHNGVYKVWFERKYKKPV